ncbi:MAG TPA: sensor histidine kinase, partial [Novosphingobium sp.]|nr:sensor histidine kinase [Novosphingobium sp.]
RQLTRPQQGSAQDGDAVEIGAYLQALVQQIEGGCCDVVGGRRLRVGTDSALVPARMAAAIGLIVSECVLNACKYAYPAGAPGEVRIDLRLASAHALRLTIEDDGADMDEDGMEAPAAGFGTRLVEMLAARVGGALLRERANPGTRVVLAVPL